MLFSEQDVIGLRFPGKDCLFLAFYWIFFRIHPMETCLSCLVVIDLEDLWLGLWLPGWSSTDHHRSWISTSTATSRRKCESSFKGWKFVGNLRKVPGDSLDWVFGPIPRAFSRQRCGDLANFTMESMEPWKKKQPRAEDGWSFPNDDVCTCLKVLELIIVDVDVLSVPAPCHFLQYHDLSKLEDSAF